MWESQDLFRIFAQMAAQSLFDLLDERLNPTVFLLGFLSKPSASQPICYLETEETDLGCDDFKSVPTLAEHLRETSSERHHFRSNAAAQQEHLNDIADDAYRDAILKVIDGKRKLRSKVSFVARPVQIANYYVFVILELERKPFENYISLTKTQIDDYYLVSRSLLESTTELFLQRCSANLQLPDRGRNLLTDFANNEEILRKAGERFTYTLSWASNSIEGGNLFETLNIISSLRYEGDASVGQIIIAERNHPNITLQVELAESVSISEYRKIRKLLQTVDDSTSIVSDGQQVFGLGSLTGDYNPQTESLFIVQFIDHYHWLITHNRQPLMRCKYGLPGLVKEGVDSVRFAELCNRFFATEANQATRLLDVIKTATQQKHGALVVVSKDAEDEAERLKYQSFRIKPLPLTFKNVHSFTSIDGAILVDPSGICYALGVILDGPATPKGDASRGSRFNSAVRYVEYINPKHPCLVIVVSEDGMVDLIPSLKPRIYRSQIDEYIKQLIDFSQSEKPDQRRFYKLYGFIERHAFYLNTQDCQTINNLRHAVEAKLKANSLVNIIRYDLTPDPEMDDTYYL